MKRFSALVLLVCALALSGTAGAFSFSMPWAKSAPQELSPQNGQLSIPVSQISDGAAHHFKVRAADGIMLTFFTLKSRDGVIRAAVDACDVCFRAGLGYVQEGDFMVCRNCGQKFASHRINVVRGGCNPAPLARQIEGDKLVITMAEINANSWYGRFTRN